MKPGTRVDYDGCDIRRTVDRCYAEEFTKTAAVTLDVGGNSGRTRRMFRIASAAQNIGHVTVFAT